MENSILKSTKSFIGSSDYDTSYDGDILSTINTALAILCDLGIGSAEGLTIVDDSATWDDLTTNARDRNMAITYVHLKAKLVFDPPANTAIIESIKETIKELEWRLANKTIEEEANQNGE